MQTGLPSRSARLADHSQLVTGEAVYPLCAQVPEVEHDHDRVIQGRIEAVQRTRRFLRDLLRTRASGLMLPIIASAAIG